MSTYRSARQYGAEQIAAFLTVVDRHLTKRVRIELIGGAAAAFAGAITTTTDLDTFTENDQALTHAVERACEESGFDLPITHAAVADIPYNAQDRLVRILSELTNLEVWVLDRHDLALSKVVRGFGHDMQQVREIHEHAALSFDLLVERFRDEMSHAMGDPSRIRENFLAMIDDLFGAIRRVAAAAALG